MLSRCLTWAVVLLALRKSADCFYLHRARDIELLVGMANEFVLEGGGVDRYFKLLAHLNEWEDLDGKDWNYKVEIIFGQTDCLYQPIRFDFKTVFFHDKHCQFVEVSAHLVKSNN